MAQNLYRRIQAKLSKKYRVELIDDITLYQTRQFIIKPITLIWGASLLLIGIVVGTAAFVVYTPTLHTLIPDYQNPDSVRIRTDEQRFVIDSLKAEVEKRDKFAVAVQRVFGTDPALAEVNPDAIRNLPIVDGANGRRAIEWEDPIRTADEAAEDLQNPPVETPPTNPAPAPVPSVPVVRVSNPVAENPLFNLFPPVENGEMRDSFSITETRAHYGVDIVAEENALIHSVAKGFVVFSEYSDDSGWVIGVSSPGNIVTFYKHNSRLLKQVGSYVYAGEPLAVIGNSGENSTGPHLHLELWQNGSPIDPANYLDFQ
jgi:murein DD-endopeptidase MepM/ murein hydrolase activator NlpD